MPVLGWNRYGKSRVRLVKVKRTAEPHAIVDLTLDVQLEGAFDRVYVEGETHTQTIEGWYTLHDVYTVDWVSWRVVEESERAEIAAEARVWLERASSSRERSCGPSGAGSTPRSDSVRNTSGK